MHVLTGVFQQIGRLELHGSIFVGHLAADLDSVGVRLLQCIRRGREGESEGESERDRGRWSTAETLLTQKFPSIPNDSLTQPTHAATLN